MITARVHPGETPSSWTMKGIIDFLTGESDQAKVNGTSYSRRGQVPFLSFMRIFLGRADTPREIRVQAGANVESGRRDRRQQSVLVIRKGP